MSNSVGPHRWQPTRPPCPWDSLGKNTGVGCHFLFQCMKMKSESEVAQLCPTLSDLMDCSLPGSTVHGIFQARRVHAKKKWGFPSGASGKESACNVGDLGSILGLGRSPEEGKGYPLQYFGLENFMDCMLLLLLSQIFQSCPTLCDPIDGSPPGSAIPGILQARTLEWAAIAFSNA